MSSQQSDEALVAELNAATGEITALRDDMHVVSNELVDALQADLARNLPLHQNIIAIERPEPDMVSRFLAAKGPTTSNGNTKALTPRGEESSHKGVLILPFVVELERGVANLDVYHSDSPEDISQRIQVFCQENLLSHHSLDALNKVVSSVLAEEV